MDISKIVREILIRAYTIAKEDKSEFITPEHILLSSLQEDIFKDVLIKLNGNIEELKTDLVDYINEYVEKIDDGEPEESIGVKNIILIATQQAAFSERKYVGLEHIMHAIYSLKDSYAVYFLEKQGLEKRDILFELSHNKVEENNLEKDAIKIIKINKEEKVLKEKEKSSFYTNLNEELKDSNDLSLIGREDIIERTIQILSRKTKNNPMHLGEPGVGKTAIAKGLVKLIIEENVPENLKNAQVFSIDISNLLAGTKYRGDFEERVKQVLDEIKTYENPIVYIDEIHNIVGAGALNGSSIDGGSLIKSYLLEGSIKFIGSTTYDDYKKHLEKDKALIRRFQIVEVKETSIDETINILNGIKDTFENYHNVKYTDEAINLAVNLSSKYINDKFLPDKAIDIIDEAGAFVNINKDKYLDSIVNEIVIEEIISKITKIPKQTIENKEVDILKKLEENLKSMVFGQEEAIKEITRCIKMSKAGLNEENKPIASMLFVGPTGVGKTEIAKVLSKNLGIDLVRFDMSEYSEKHAAAKLIGSPPGYVGYDEGGLLTDTIRKKPNCILLLDEVEKSHPDILSVLLQVMDYATLTDNKGRKADFRNVILIMTSNAGARNIGKNLVGFRRETLTSNAIDEEVKRFFTPEFRNRLNKIIIFNQINKDMAISITKKELNKLQDKLKHKNINIDFNEDVIKFISDKGLSNEFGAREIIRVIDTSIKPLFIDELLFGSLSKGGNCTIKLEDDKIKLEIIK